LIVEVYQTADGRQPYAEWLRNLNDRQARARIRARLARLQVGNLGDCKSLGGGLFELRIDYGPGYRVYLTQRGETWILLLCGGDKRTQSRDIERVRAYLADYVRRQ
jgi:putative addiction module killer protein